MSCLELTSKRGILLLPKEWNKGAKREVTSGDKK